MDENLQAALRVADALDALGVRWFLGGSLASSAHGVPRATLDADIVADLQPQQVKLLLKAIGEGWYADEQAMRDAIANRSSFNLIHLDTAMKVDVFVPKHRKFDAEQFDRVQRTPVAEGSSIEVPVCAAEDIVVAKLEWFRMGHETSDRQWNDILGVLRLNTPTLDFALMQHHAMGLGVLDLLTKALQEARISDSGHQ